MLPRLVLTDTDTGLLPEYVAYVTNMTAMAKESA